MASKHNPVIWFEIPVSDLQRARKFYAAALGVDLGPPVQMGPSTMSFFPMEQNAVGAGGALLHSPQAQPSQQGVTIYFSVESIDPVLKRIEAADGKICLPRTSIGQYGFIAQFLDTEGNRVALHEIPAEMRK